MASKDGFSAEERAAIKQRAAELKAQGGRGADKAVAEEAELLAKIAEMPDADRVMAERVHVIVTTTAPELAPRLWYGQPSYARKGKAVVFFRSGQMDQERYSTLGFSNEANLDDESGLWPTAYALTEVNEVTAKKISELVRQAVTTTA